MPRAIKALGRLIRFESPGVLIECDPSIKAIILKIDQEKHDYIVEDLDDQTLVIKESQLQRLKARMEEVNICREQYEADADLSLKELASTQQMPEDNSEDD
ncbi:MAG: hypothetical protein Q9164_006189 [Protoblastenia rupestris]